MTKEEFKKQFMKDQAAKKKKATLEHQGFREDVFTNMFKRKNLKKRVGQF